MEAVFIYFFKVILASGLFFGYYRLALREKSFHQYNRFYLLFSVVTSFLLPLLKVEFFTIKLSPKILNYSNLIFAKTSDLKQENFDYNYLIIFLLNLISILFLVNFIIGIFKILKLKKSSQKENFADIKIYHTETEEAPFSFFKSLFWKDSIAISSESGNQILRHEMVHIQQNHSWDRVFLQIVCSIFWFNPFFHLIKKEIVLIHEYLADNLTIKNADTKAFAQMLLATTPFSGRQFASASPFFSSNLKKRLKMLQKPKTKNGYSQRILALPVAIAVAFAFMVKAKNQEIAKVNSLVNSVKNDTIPKKGIDEINAKIQAKNQEMEPLRKDLDKDYESARIIGEQLRKKGELLQKLTNDKNASPKEIDNVSAEMDALSDKIDKIFDAEDFKKNLTKMDGHFADLDKLYSDLDKFYASKDFQKSLNFNGKGIETAKVFDDAEEAAKEAKKTAQEASRDAVLAGIAAKEADKRAKEIDTEEARKLAKKAYEKATEARENSKIASEKAGYKAIHLGENKILIVNKNDKKNTYQIFIDGKPATDEQLNSMPEKGIESAVMKKISDSEMAVYITTRK